MASRHFSIKHGKVGRGKKHALYIAGQGNYADRNDVVFMVDVNMPSWARDGADFFDAADQMERANGRTYTEFEFAIPRDISDAVSYAKEFASQQLGKNHPYRLAVHDKLASDGGRNVHAHLMFTERKLDDIDRDREHFFLRANTKNPANGGAGKDRKWNDKSIVKTVRQEYSTFAKSFGIELDLRSNLAQGLDMPEPKIGPIHDRSEQNKNRQNIVTKVLSIRDERSTNSKPNEREKKEDFLILQNAKERRKELWTSFHKQRRSNYLRLANEFKVSQVHHKEKLKQIKYEYFNKREMLKNDRGLKYVERRAAISIANIERITQELTVKAEFEAIRLAIKTEQNEHYFEKYSLFLESQSQMGDLVAQAEFNRLIPNKSKALSEQDSILADELIYNLDPAHMNLKYEISDTGEVTYQMRGIDVIKDIGKRVDLLLTDDLTIETALRLAQAKFGSKFTLTGSKEFQVRIAQIAAEQNLKVEFIDREVQQAMLRHKEQLRNLRHIEENLRASATKLHGIGHLEAKDSDLINANVAGLAETNHVAKLKQASLVEAELLVKAKGYNSAKPTDKKYIGSVIAVTRFHAIQTIGKNKVVIHDLTRIQGKQPIEVGARLEINYQTGSPIIKEPFSNGSLKSRTR